MFFAASFGSGFKVSCQSEKVELAHPHWSLPTLVHTDPSIWSIKGLFYFIHQKSLLINKMKTESEKLMKILSLDVSCPSLDVSMWNVFRGDCLWALNTLDMPESLHFMKTALEILRFLEVSLFFIKSQQLICAFFSTWFLPPWWAFASEHLTVHWSYLK